MKSAWAVGFAAAATVLVGGGGCADDSSVPRCTPENCAGCCLDGYCQAGTAPQACGIGGSPCLECPPGMSCPAGTCEGTTTCGDTTIDPGEECDDGNRTDGDGCSASCRLEGAADADADADADSFDGVETGTETDADADADADDSGGTVEPPLGGASGGSGGAAPVTGELRTAGRAQYRLIVPAGYAASRPTPLLVVFSGTEGGAAMTSNLRSVAAYVGIEDFIIAVLDGTTYYGDGAAGEPVLDDVRARYNIDNDATYLLSESAGTSAGLQLGLSLRQSYFAAYWANDVNDSAVPSRTAAALGFAPWGNAGPGGDLPDARAIVAGMRAAGYRLPADAPYSGAGSDTHGSTEQFLAACSFFPGKSRR